MKKQKNIRHNNIMGRKEKAEQSMEIICRGCTMRGRDNIWQGFVSSIADTMNREIDNSYLVFKEEPSNQYDPNAIMVVCRGEFFGTVGYVGREYTGKVKELLEICKKYRVDMIDESEVGKSEIHLIVYWSK